MTEKLPAGRLVKVSFEVCLPVAATPDEIEQWVNYSALNTGCMPVTNPLRSHEAESFNGSVMLTDTGMQGERVEYGHRQEGGATYYNVRYVRTPA